MPYFRRFSCAAAFHHEKPSGLTFFVCAQSRGVAWLFFLSSGRTKQITTCQAWAWMDFLFIKQRVVNVFLLFIIALKKMNALNLLDINI